MASPPTSPSDASTLPLTKKAKDRDALLEDKVLALLNGEEAAGEADTSDDEGAGEAKAACTEPDLRDTHSLAWQGHVAACAQVLRECDAVLVAAGAGMSVDAGLPDYRGKKGWDTLFPTLALNGITYTSIATSQRLEEDPTLFWGWHAHAQRMFQSASPHSGYTALLNLVKDKPAGYFVYTSNVDEHFARAGFESSRIVECHGSLFRLQCSKHMEHGIWRAQQSQIDGVQCNESTFRAEGASLPKCKAHRCECLARPNVLLFEDLHWCPARTSLQLEAFKKWQEGCVATAKRCVILEIGVGVAVPTVSGQVERLFFDLHATNCETTIIRINPDKRGGIPYPGTHYHLSTTAMEALSALAASVTSTTSS